MMNIKMKDQALYSGFRHPGLLLNIIGFAAAIIFICIQTSDNQDRLGDKVAAAKAVVMGHFAEYLNTGNRIPEDIEATIHNSLNALLFKTTEEEMISRTSKKLHDDFEFIRNHLIIKDVIPLIRPENIDEITNEILIPWRSYWVAKLPYLNSKDEHIAWGLFVVAYVMLVAFAYWRGGAQPPQAEPLLTLIDISMYLALVSLVAESWWGVSLFLGIPVSVALFEYLRAREAYKDSATNNFLEFFPTILFGFAIISGTVWATISVEIEFGVLNYIAELAKQLSITMFVGLGLLLLVQILNSLIRSGKSRDNRPTVRRH